MYSHRTCIYSRRVCRGGWRLCQNGREEWVNMYSQDVCLQQKSLQRRMDTPSTTRSPTTPTMMPIITPGSVKGLQEVKTGNGTFNKMYCDESVIKRTDLSMIDK